MQIPVKQPHRVIRYLQTQSVEYDSKSRINININCNNAECWLPVQNAEHQSEMLNTIRAKC